MSPSPPVPLETNRLGAVKRYVLRRCMLCRKFMGIVITDAYHRVARTICSDCYDSSVRPRLRR